MSRLRYARARKRAFSAIGSAKTTAPLLAAVVSGADVELPRRQFIIKDKDGSPAPRDLPLPPDLAFGYDVPSEHGAKGFLLRVLADRLTPNTIAWLRQGTRWDDDLI